MKGTTSFLLLFHGQKDFSDRFRPISAVTPLHLRLLHIVDPISLRNIYLELKLRDFHGIARNAEIFTPTVELKTQKNLASSNCFYIQFFYSVTCFDGSKYMIVFFLTFRICVCDKKIVNLNNVKPNLTNIKKKQILTEVLRLIFKKN